jgi:hypothetical protein
MHRHPSPWFLVCALVAFPLPSAGDEEGEKPIHRTNAEIMREAATRAQPTEVQDREIRSGRWAPARPRTRLSGGGPPGPHPRPESLAPRPSD